MFLNWLRALHKLRDLRLPVLGVVSINGAVNDKRYHPSRLDHNSFGTVGVNANIIEASWRALVEAVEYVVLTA